MSEMLKRVHSCLNKLSITPTEAIIVGSGILDVLGIRDSHDIDLLVSEDTFNQKGFEQVGEEVRYSNGEQGRRIDETEIMYTWFQDSYAEVLPKTVVLDDIQFLSIEETRAWKLRLARTKDMQDIQLIDNYLSTH